MEPQLKAALRDSLIDLYYKGYHEGKGDIPNMDDVEITRVENEVLAALQPEIERLELAARIDELERASYMINQNLGTKHAYRCRLDELTQLTRKDSKDE